MNKPVNLLAIESSCDDTGAAIFENGKLLSNVVSSQKIHGQYGGVVPEMASREHMKNILHVVNIALEKAAIQKEDIDAVAFTQAPGLIGSLMVGAAFAKGFTLARQLPLIAVHHMQAHVLAHFIEDPKPEFPFLCLTVSGGHTQIVLCKSHLEMEVLGETRDDAAGEAFDKTAKMLGLPYPGGPLVDKYAAMGDPVRFKFPITNMPNYEFSFSGIKTAVLYFLRDEQLKNEHFVAENMNDLCASIQYTIIQMLMNKLKKAAEELDIKHIGIAGGVSANSGLRKTLEETGKKLGWKVYIPKFEFCTDNAAMIGITGWYKYLNQDFAPRDISPSARAKW